jgi:hypothetical protein
MGRLVAVSYKPYRMHVLELHDGGRAACRVIIHPPAGRGTPQEVVTEGAAATLGELIHRAKTMIDAVLGPRPPVTRRMGAGRGF